MKLRTYFFLAFGILAIIIIAALSAAANQLLRHQFHEYVLAMQEKDNQALVTSLERSYSSNEDTWDFEWLEERCVTALENGQILTIAAADGKVIWNAHTHDSDRCSAIIDSMQKNVADLYPETSGKYVEKEYIMTSNNKEIAIVRIGSYEPYSLTRQDVDFINSLNNIFIVAAVLSMALALIMAIILASRLSKPISEATSAANKIAGGDHEKLMNENSTILEMTNLAAAVNHLSDSLVEQEQLRTRLTRDIAHELRTPISTLQAQIEAMLDGIWEPDSKRLLSLQEEILRLGRLVEDLTNLARYENEVLPLNPANVDLADLAGEVAERYRAQIEAKNLSLELELESAIVEIDTDRISQVMINLIDNAIKYTSEGRISVSIKNTGSTALLKISDTGTGIPPEHINHIFDRFYRADEARRRDTGGAGIGLSIAKTIVIAHNGSISVESEPSKGSTFTVSIPLSKT